MTKKYPLSVQYRLHSRKDYLRFFSQAEVFKLSRCMVFRVPNDFGHFRLGVTLKMKLNSVQRNRIKRVVREQFRLLGQTLSSYDYNVLISNPKMVEKEPQKVLVTCIKTELEKALLKK